MFDDYRTDRCIPTNMIVMFCNSSFKLSTHLSDIWYITITLYMILYTIFFFERFARESFCILINLLFIRAIINFNVISIKFIEFLGYYYKWNKRYNKPWCNAFWFIIVFVRSCVNVPSHWMFLILSLIILSVGKSLWRFFNAI